jgi:hypothetical protein
MFDSLDERIKLDEHKATSNQERMLRWVMVTLVSVLVFGGLYLGVHMLEGS